MQRFPQPKFEAVAVGGRWEAFDRGQPLLQVGNGFRQGNEAERPLSGFAPQARGLLDKPCLSAVPRQKFGVTLDNISELALKSFGDASVKRASRLAQ